MTIRIQIESTVYHVAAMRNALQQLGWNVTDGTNNLIELTLTAHFDSRKNKHKTAADVMIDLAKDINTYHN